MGYLLAHIWMQLLFAGGIGVLAGYILWGAKRKQAAPSASATASKSGADTGRQDRLAGLEDRLCDTTARLEQCHGDRLRKDARIRELEALLDEMRGEAAFTGPRPDPNVTPIQPTGREAPRPGGADDLMRIQGIGPTLQSLCHDLGIYHFDQLAALTRAELAWIDAHLPGFPGRATRDNWPGQAQRLLDAPTG
ncbi:MAG: hypothetical protein ABNH26_09215 [Celeribacter sp.]|jgi:predicted flap endonuclease-1-like 5' DNA nuclease